MSKLIKIQRSIIVDLDWLEEHIEAITGGGAWNQGRILALNEVLVNSTTMSKLADVLVCMKQLLMFAENNGDIVNGFRTREIVNKLKQDFSNSEIEIK